MATIRANGVENLARNAGLLAQQNAEAVRYGGGSSRGQGMRRVGVIVWVWRRSRPRRCCPCRRCADPASLPRGQERTSPYMRVFGVTQPPYGFVKFCERMPDECQQGPQEDQRFSATPERLTELDTINRAVNHEIAPATDIEIYGAGRILDHPDDQGRLRGLRAAEAQAPDGARLARERAADDGGARREGRGACRADRAHRCRAISSSTTRSTR